MSTEQYFDLIDELCLIASISDPQTQYDSCNVEVLGIPFTLMQSEKGVIAFCDYGVPPEENIAEILWTMMEINMYMLTEGAGQYAINPDTRHVLLIKKIPLENLTAAALLSVLAMLASSAKDWRETHFLETVGPQLRNAGASPLSGMGLLGGSA